MNEIKSLNEQQVYGNKVIDCHVHCLQKLVKVGSLVGRPFGSGFAKKISQ